MHDPSRPAAVEALLDVATHDPTSNVRLACILSIGKMQVNTPAVFKVLKGLKKDADQRVREQAAKTRSGIPRQLPPATE